jgi:phenol hydroxylase P4 protein
VRAVLRAAAARDEVRRPGQRRAARHVRRAPDFKRIDWAQAEWFKSGQPFKPDFDKSLAENGLGHKDVIRFRTPGLAGIKGSAH